MSVALKRKKAELERWEVVDKRLSQFFFVVLGVSILAAIYEYIVLEPLWDKVSSDLLIIVMVLAAIMTFALYAKVEKKKEILARRQQV